MSKAVSEGQALSLVASFAVDTPWKKLNINVQPFIELSPKERGERFAAFLKNSGRMIIGEPKVIQVDRTKPFNPTEFIREGWAIVEETDERSLALTEVDLSKVSLETMLKKDENSILGEERQKRLKKTSHIRLDAKVLQTLWENKAFIPEAWKEKTNGDMTNVSFDGTILQSPDGCRCVLHLFWLDRRWFWDYNWLGRDWDANNPSAVLATS